VGENDGDAEGNSVGLRDGEIDGVEVGGSVAQTTSNDVS